METIFVIYRKASITVDWIHIHKDKLSLLNKCKDNMQSEALYDTFPHFSL